MVKIHLSNELDLQNIILDHTEELTYQVLYNNNMGSMCHVRGVMQHTTKHDFLVSHKHSIFLN